MANSSRQLHINVATKDPLKRGADFYLTASRDSPLLPIQTSLIFSHDPTLAHTLDTLREAAGRISYKIIDDVIPKPSCASWRTNMQQDNYYTG